METCERCEDWPEGLIGHMMTDLHKATLFVSVGKATPPVNTPVLVPLWNCKHKYGIALWDGMDWWIANEERMPKYAALSHITHWKELPALPKHSPNE